MSINNTFVNKKTPKYQDVDGLRIPSMLCAETYRSALAYKPRPDDLFIVSYPKCGSTWMQYIVGCIYREGRPFSSALDYFSQSPFIGLTGTEAALTMKRPGAIKVHLPYHLAPRSAEAKYIFVARNPKDCCVSFYHQTVNLPLYDFEGGEFDDYFELFVNGEIEFGDYFDTLLSWYEHRKDPNVFFITYEQMKEDITTSVLKIAEFMGTQYKEALENKEQMLKDVIYHSSFGYMRQNLNKQFAELGRMPKDEILNNPDISPGMKKMFGGEGQVFKDEDSCVNIVRKGIVGDWRNYFSKEQNERMMKKYYERTVGTDIPELWKNYV